MSNKSFVVLEFKFRTRHFVRLFSIINGFAFLSHALNAVDSNDFNGGTFGKSFAHTQRLDGFHIDFDSVIYI